MKYILTDETMEFEGNTLHRIKATQDIKTRIGTVYQGNLGGFIKEQYNLSQEGECWVFKDAIVAKKARVSGNAIVDGKAIVSDYAYVHGNASVTHSANIRDYATIMGRALIKDNAVVCESALVGNNAIVEDNAVVKGGARICNTATISGNALVSGNTTVSAVVTGNAVLTQQQGVNMGVCMSNIDEDLEESIRVQTGLIPCNGEVIAYKQVNNNLTSRYEPTFQYKIGEWVEVENYEIAPVSCAKGLHFSHAGYWNEAITPVNSTFLIAKIRLEDIITVQGGKIRCKRAFILGSYKIKK